MKAHDPGGKLTTFHLVAITAAIGCAIAAFILVRRAWGWPFAVLAVPVAFYLGLTIGWIPARVTGARILGELRRASVDELRERLRTQWFLSHYIIPILYARGESLESLKRYTLELMLASDPAQRWQGWRNLNLLFPKDAATFRGPDDEERIRALLAT